jgi:hypothetical protein
MFPFLFKMQAGVGRRGDCLTAHYHSKVTLSAKGLTSAARETGRLLDSTLSQ